MIMAVVVRLCVPLQRFTHGKEVVYHEAGRLRDILYGLDREHKGLLDMIILGGKIKDHFLISINDKLISDAEGLDTVLRDGDEISIVPLVIGG